MPDRQMFRNDTFAFAVQVTVIPAGAPPGTQPMPQNVTGWHFWSTGKYQVQDADNLAVFQVTDTGGGIVITDPINGKILVTVPRQATGGFPDGVVQLVYDVQGQDTSGNIFTIEFGTIEVMPDVTRTPGF